MTLYNQLMHSGNPQAAVQMVISLLQKHSPNEVAELMGISVRWVYTLRKRYLDSNGNLASCLLKRGRLHLCLTVPLYISKNWSLILQKKLILAHSALLMH